MKIYIQFHFFAIWRLSASILSIMPLKTPASSWSPSELAILFNIDPRCFGSFAKFKDTKGISMWTTRAFRLPFYFLWLCYKYRSSPSEVFLIKGVLKICSKFTGEHPCRSANWIKLLCNFIEIALWHGCSPVNLLYIFKTPFPKNTSEGLLLQIVKPVTFI